MAPKKQASLTEILAEEEQKEFSYSKSENLPPPRKPSMWKSLKSEEVLAKV